MTRRGERRLTAHAEVHTGGLAGFPDFVDAGGAHGVLEAEGWRATSEGRGARWVDDLLSLTPPTQMRTGFNRGRNRARDDSFRTRLDHGGSRAERRAVVGSDCAPATEVRGDRRLVVLQWMSLLQIPHRGNTLSGVRVEEALYRAEAMRRPVDIDLAQEGTTGEWRVWRFRKLNRRQGSACRMLAKANGHQVRQGMKSSRGRGGGCVDHCGTAADGRTRGATRDPERQRARKGSQWSPRTTPPHRGGQQSGSRAHRGGRQRGGRSRNLEFAWQRARVRGRVPATSGPSIAYSPNGGVTGAEVGRRLTSAITSCRSAKCNLVKDLAAASRHRSPNVHRYSGSDQSVPPCDQTRQSR